MPKQKTPKPKTQTTKRNPSKLKAQKLKTGIALEKDMSDKAYQIKMKKLDNARNKQLQQTERLRIRYSDNKALAVGRGVREATTPIAASTGTASLGNTAGNSVVTMSRAKYGSPLDAGSLKDTTGEDETNSTETGWNRDRSRG